MRKIIYLNGLRGLAAFIVVIHHFILAFYPALFFGSDIQTHLKPGVEAFLSGSAFNLFYSGNFAVCIFFVLSGFVLSHKFLLKKDYAILTEGATKRYVRLVIPVAVSILLAYILMKFNLFYNTQAAKVSGSDWFGEFWTFTPNLMDALNQIFIGTFFTNDFAYNPVLWTISIEFFGSLLIFSFLALFGNMRNRYIVYIIGIIFFFQTYYLAFILGILLSDLMANKNLFIKKFGKSKLILLGLLLLGLFLGSYPSGRGSEGTVYNYINIRYFPEFDVLCHVIGAFIVILVLLNSKKMQKILSFKYFLFLGEISFTMYLLHFIIIGSLSSFIFIKLESHMPYADAFLFTFFLSVAFIITASYLMYLYVDKKAIYLSKSMYKRLFQVKTN